MGVPTKGFRASVWQMLRAVEGEGHACKISTLTPAGTGAPSPPCLYWDVAREGEVGSDVRHCLITQTPVMPGQRLRCESHVVCSDESVGAENGTIAADIKRVPGFGCRMRSVTTVTSRMATGGLPLLSLSLPPSPCPFHSVSIPRPFFALAPFSLLHRSLATSRVLLPFCSLQP
eukprot:1114969-Rhodomonas_salina.3